MKPAYPNELPEEWREFATVFAALGDPVRQRILLLFEPDEAIAIKDIAALFPLSRTAVVHHLAVLERAGIVRTERHGKETRYSARPDTVLRAVTALRQYILGEFPGSSEGEMS